MLEILFEKLIHSRAKELTIVKFLSYCLLAIGVTASYSTLPIFSNCQFTSQLSVLTGFFFVLLYHYYCLNEIIKKKTTCLARKDDNYIDSRFMKICNGDVHPYSRNEKEKYIINCATQGKKNRIRIVMVILVSAMVILLTYDMVYPMENNDKINRRYIMEYYNTLNIVTPLNFDEDSLQLKENNIKLWSFFSKVKQDNLKANFPFSIFPDDISWLYFNTIYNDVVGIRYYKENQYLVYLQVKECIPVHALNDDTYRKTPDEKKEAAFNQLKKYFQLKSRSRLLKYETEAQLIVRINNFLEKECDLNHLNEAILWQIGAYFALTPINNYNAADAFKSVRVYPWVRLVTVDPETKKLNFEDPPT